MRTHRSNYTFFFVASSALATACGFDRQPRPKPVNPTSSTTESTATSASTSGPATSLTNTSSAATSDTSSTSAAISTALPSESSDQGSHPSETIAGAASRAPRDPTDSSGFQDAKSSIDLGSADDGLTTGADGSNTSQIDTGSGGCGSPHSVQSGIKMVNIDGTERRYILDVPNTYNPETRYALVFVWHPLGGSAVQTANGYDGLKSLANDSAIFVAPDGLPGGGQQVSGQGWWNQGGNDMKLLAAIFEELTNSLCIAEQRVFSTGFSFGGMMSYSVGYQFDIFRAIAPTSGNLDAIPHEENNLQPLAIMAFHGASDTFVGTASGRAALDKYVGRNNCDPQSHPVEPSPCVEFQGCDVPTIWCEYPGEHSPWNQMPRAVWNFFSHFE